MQDKAGGLEVENPKRPGDFTVGGSVEAFLLNIKWHDPARALYRGCYHR